MGCVALVVAVSSPTSPKLTTENTHTRQRIALLPNDVPFIVPRLGRPRRRIGGQPMGLQVAPPNLLQKGEGQNGTAWVELALQRSAVGTSDPKTVVAQTSVDGQVRWHADGLASAAHRGRPCRKT